MTKANSNIHCTIHTGEAAPEIIFKKNRLQINKDTLQNTQNNLDVTTPTMLNIHKFKKLKKKNFRYRLSIFIKSDEMKFNRLNKYNIITIYRQVISTAPVPGAPQQIIDRVIVNTRIYPFIIPLVLPPLLWERGCFFLFDSLMKRSFEVNTNKPVIIFSYVYFNSLHLICLFI